MAAECCPKDVNVCVARYTDEYFDYAFKQYNGVDAQDLSGWSFLFQVRTTAGTSVVSLTNSGMTIDDDAGTVRAALSEANTTALTDTTYYAGLLVTKSDGETWAHPDRLVLTPYTPTAHP